jgi:hypothetical protein
MKRQNLEHHEVKKFVAWFNLQYRDIPLLKFVNEGKRSFAAAAYLRAEGMRKGAPDLIVCKPQSDEGEIKYGALFIEMKSKGGVLSDAQKELHLQLQDSCYKVITCFTFEAAKEETEKYLS